MPERSRTRRLLALAMPFLPTDRWRHAQARLAGGGLPPTPDRPEDSWPLVLTERQRGTMRLAAVDPAAARAGLAPGMALADARARVPELKVAPHDAAADAAWLKALADGALRYTPLLALDPPDGLILDITGAAHPYGGEAGLVRDLLGRLEPLHAQVRWAVADHAASARALARWGAQTIPARWGAQTIPVRWGAQTIPARDMAPQETLAHWEESAANDARAAIARLPVAALELDADATRALQRAGLKRVGDLAVRPMAGLAARFGAGAVLALRQLLGEADSPIRPHEKQPPVWLLRRLPEPLLAHDPAMAILEALAGQAVRQMAERGEGGRRFVAHFFRTDGTAGLLAVETGQPVRDVAVLMRLFAERMAALDDPMDPGFGYDAVGLQVPLAEPLAPVQPVWHADGTAEANARAEALGALIDRLGARLGPARVQRLAPADSHVPEQAELALPAVEAPAMQWKPAVEAPAMQWKPAVEAPAFRYLPATRAPVMQWKPAADAADGVPMRPICLIDPPQPVEVLAEVPDGPPRRFRWRGRLHQVRLAEGPERIASEWWRKPAGHVPGGALPTRDYYRVEDMAGRRFWLFRHGLYGERAAPRWYLHGLFA